MLLPTIHYIFHLFPETLESTLLIHSNSHSGDMITVMILVIPSFVLLFVWDGIEQGN